VTANSCRPSWTAPFARLNRAPTTPVHKFSEKGKDGKVREGVKSELELQMDELRKRPFVLKFAERIAQPLTRGSTEVSKVRNHFRRFSENYRNTGTTEQKLVDAFKLYRKKNPSGTFEQFLGKEEHEVAA